MIIKSHSPTPCDLSWPVADTKVVLKSSQNLKIMLSAIRLLWVANSVGWANYTCMNHFTYVFTVPC